MNTVRLTITTLLALIPVVSAQDQESQRIPVKPRSSVGIDEVLASTDPRIIACGAHWAEQDQNDHQESLGQALRRLVRMPRAKTRFAVLSVLDATVRKDLSPPTRDIAPFLRDITFAPSIILLARRANANQGLFLEQFRRLSQSRPNKCWQVYGNLLVAQRVKGFAVLLLPGLRLQLDVHVVSPNMRGGGGKFGRSYGDGKVKVPEGYPPTPYYKLSGNAGASRPGGGLSVEHSRRLRKKQIFGTGSSSQVGDGMGQHIAWLNELLATDDTKLHLLARDTRQHLFVDNDSLLTAVKTWKEEFRSDYRVHLLQLVKQKLISAEEAATAKLAISVRLQDHRNKPRQDLPKIPEDRQ